jgi:hypothetical protein
MAKPPGDPTLGGPSNFFQGRRLTAAVRKMSTRIPATRLWHLWSIVIPRRSITGRLVWGRVWRRHDGRRWIYKKFVEFDDRWAKPS